MSEPVLIHEMRKNSLEHVRVSLTEYNGVQLVDARIFYRKHETGDMLPSQKGVCLKLDRLDELIDALQKARTQAAERGWIGGAV